jgi:hypothetical protein
MDRCAIAAVRCARSLFLPNGLPEVHLRLPEVPDLLFKHRNRVLDGFEDMCSPSVRGS